MLLQSKKLLWWRWKNASILSIVIKTHWNWSKITKISKLINIDFLKSYLSAHLIYKNHFVDGSFFWNVFCNVENYHDLSNNGNHCTNQVVDNEKTQLPPFPFEIEQSVIFKIVMILAYLNHFCYFYRFFYFD